MVQRADRSAGRVRLMVVALWVAAISLLGFGLYLVLPTDEDGGSGGRDLTGVSRPEGLSRIDPSFDDLSHPNPDRQATAEENLRQFLSRPGPVQLGRGTHPVRLAAEDWFQQYGHAKVVEPLLKRFDQDRRPADAHDLLQNVARLFPELVKTPSGDSLILERSEAESQGSLDLGPLAVCRRVQSDGSVASYTIYQLEVGESAPGSLLTLTLLEKVRRERRPSHLRRLLRLVRRTPDRELAVLVQHFLKEHPGGEEKLPPALLESRVGPRSGYSSLRSWADDPERARARARTLGEALRASEPALVIAALDRFRWDPVSSLDSEIIWLARNAPTPRVRDAATRALAAIPTPAAAELVGSRLEASEHLDATMEVLRSWGHDEESSGWDVWATPATYREKLEGSLETIGAHRGQRRAEIDRTFSHGKPSVSDLRLLQILVRRGDLPADWYDAQRGARLVAGLTAEEAPLRAATVRAMVPWELDNPRVLPHFAARLADEQAPPAVRALLDAMLLIGGREGYPAVVETLAHSNTFHGLIALEAYAQVFPRLDRQGPLLNLTRSVVPGQQAMVAYLLGALPASSATIPFLLEGLESPDEKRRFWSFQTLRRQYGQEFEYVPGDSSEKSRSAIDAWRRFLKNRPQ